MGEKTKGIVAGSFDPITNGHLWLIQRAAELVDELHVVIGVNTAKKYYFSRDERVKMVTDVLATKLSHAEYNKVIIESHEGLLISYADSVDAQYIIRGIRDTNDFTYEHQIQMVNRKISKRVQTLYFIPPVEYTEVSSSTVKGIVGLPGWESVVDDYVAPPVMQAFKEKLLSNK